MKLILLKRFAKDRAGHFALLTAILLSPIVLIVMSTINYVMLFDKTFSLNLSLEAAQQALDVYIKTNAGKSNASAEEYAKDFVSANLNGSLEKLSIKIIPRITKPTLSASMDNPPLYFGAKAISIESVAPPFSEKKFPQRAEIVFLIDHSDWQDDDFTKVLASVHSFLQKLYKKYTAGQARGPGTSKVAVSIVPFGAFVNVGQDKRQAPWMDNNGISPLHFKDFFDEFHNKDPEQLLMISQDKQLVSTRSSTNIGKLRIDYATFLKSGSGWKARERNTPFTRFTIFDLMQTMAPQRIEWLGCVETRGGYHAYSDREPTQTDPASLFVPALSYVWDHQNHKIRGFSAFFDKALGTNPGEPYDAQKGCLQQNSLVPLTDISTGEGFLRLHDKVSHINSARIQQRDLNEALAWGRRVLSSRIPFQEGHSFHQEKKKIIFLITAGTNFLGRFSAKGYLFRNKNNYIPENVYGNIRLIKGKYQQITPEHLADKSKKADNIMNSLCNDIKTKGSDRINIVVLQVKKDGEYTNSINSRDVLSKCASPKMYFNNPEDSSGDIDKVMKHIYGVFEDKFLP